MSKKIAVFGLGYVGSVTAGIMAYHGHDVVGCDIVAAKNRLFGKRQAPVKEYGLQDLLKEASGQINATKQVSTAVAKSDIGFVCVGTPLLGNSKYDLTALRSVICSIGAALKMQGRDKYTIAIRSTMLPGTTRTEIAPRLRDALCIGRAHELPAGISVVVNPEFMREGTAIGDSLYLQRVVVGQQDAEGPAREVAHLWQAEKEFYTCWETAESVKIMDNTWHALKICFANEMGRWLRRATAETDQAFEIFYADKQLNMGPEYLRPGWAYGGSCLPKDIEAMEEFAGYELPLLSAIDLSNANYISFIRRCITTLKPERVAIYGMAFKQFTSDNRGSQSIELEERLCRAGVMAITTDKIKECYDADVIVLTHAPTKKELLELTKHVKPLGVIIDVVHVTKPAFALPGKFRWESPFWH